MARFRVSVYSESDMAKPIPQSELDSIENVLGRFSEGASVEDLLGTELRFPRRTLQRYLAMLVEQGRLSVEGKARARRYRLPTDSSSPPTSSDYWEQTTGIEVSAEGNDILRAIRRPIQQRRSVGYARDFLDAYRPNETFYLPDSVRHHLRSLGSTPATDLPAGTYVRQIFNRLLIDLSWNSSRLEGNTYSLLETQRLLELGENAEAKDLRETQMILNHKAAIELLVDQAAEIGFNRYTICNLHALLSDNLLSDPEACGRLRSIAVGISGTTFHPLEVPQLIDECFQQVLDTADAIDDPFEQAMFAMVHLPYLQPFEDVNKRVSRLAANIPLIRQNLSPLSFVDVPTQAYVDAILGVYELNRVDLLRDLFIWAYERSCTRYAAVRQSLGEPDAFRMRYRAALVEVVAQVVRGRLDKVAAGALVRQRAAERILEDDRAHFADVAETELVSLHEGNIARYRLRPLEYQAWREIWR